MLRSELAILRLWIGWCAYHYEHSTSLQSHIIYKSLIVIININLSYYKYWKSWYFYINIRPIINYTFIDIEIFTQFQQHQLSSSVLARNASAACSSPGLRISRPPGHAAEQTRADRRIVSPRPRAARLKCFPRRPHTSPIVSHNFGGSKCTGRMWLLQSFL